jgi:hypothetical protein
MAFLRTIRNSIYNPAFYSELLSKPLSFSFKYFYTLVAILSLGLAVIVGIKAIPTIRLFSAEVVGKVVNYYPEELVITIAHGKASTNVAEPYFLKLPDDFESKTSAQGVSTSPDIAKYDNFLVIDTASPLSIERFKEHKTIVLLSGSDAMIADRRGNIRIHNLKNVPDVKIDRAWVSNMAGKIGSLLKVAMPVVVVGAFAVGVVGFSFKLLYLLLAALLIWLILKIKKVPAGYSKAYQIGLHAMTLGILAQSVFYLLGASQILSLFTILLLAVVLINCSAKEGSSAPAVAQP